MPGTPQVREVGWFITGRDHDPVYHLFVRLWHQMDGAGWRVEVRERHGSRRAEKVYATEENARSVLQAIYDLADQSPPLPTRKPGQPEKGRWRITAYDPI